MNKHLKLGLEEPIVEEDYPALSPDEYTVWAAVSAVSIVRPRVAVARQRVRRVEPGDPALGKDVVGRGEHFRPVETSDVEIHFRTPVFTKHDLGSAACAELAGRTR